MDRRQFIQTSMCATADMLLPATAISAQAHDEARVFDIHVATHGDDANPGTEEKPFATIERARKEILARKTQILRPHTVWIHSGTYYLDQPLIFRPEDSGTAASPITYAAWQDDFVTISGGRRLNCQWKPHRGSILKCFLPEVKRGNLDFTQLFIAGKRQVRARYPKYDFKNPLVSGNGYVDVKDPSEPWPNVEFHFDPSTFTDKRWSNPQKAVVHLFPLDYWGNLQWEVRDIDWHDHAIQLGWGGFQLNEHLFGRAATGIGKSQLYHEGYKSRFFIENVFEELDAPGEWYLDADRGVLYAIPPQQMNLDGELVEAPILESVISFQGSQRQPVQYINLVGFRIAHTTSTFLKTYEAPSRGDWTIHRCGGIFMEGAENCAIERCFFDALGGNALFLNGYNRGNRIYGNRFSDIGDSAICLVGCGQQIQGTNRPLPSGNLVSNNLIHDCGFFGKQIAGVFLSVSENNVVSHNRIYNMPRAAICVDDGWGGGHVIEFNYIHDTVRETHDHGPFNSWGRGRFWCMEQSHGEASHGSGYHDDDPNYIFYYPEADGRTTVIRNNLFREPPSVHQLGIDLDDGSSHYHIYNNVCIGVAIKLREGDYRTVENNLFIHPANPPAFHQGYEGNHDRFINNVIITSSAQTHAFGKSSIPGDSYQIALPPRNGPILSLIDHNLFYNDLGQFFGSVTPRDGARMHYSMEQWQTLGYDIHSIYGDPQFVDPDHGDYRFRSDSPALRIGCKDIDLSGVGLLQDFPRRWVDENAITRARRAET